jgi:YHS domain-containing protein
MTDIPEGFKRCLKCGEIKAFSEFHKNKNCKDGHKSWCKECMKEYMKEYSKKYNIQHYNEQIKRLNKYNKCVKNPKCPLVGGGGAEFVIFKCPICGTQFRKIKSYVDWKYEKNGQIVFYCSKECHNESMRKSHKTDYEKNIKRIRKEQRL